MRQSIISSITTEIGRYTKVLCQSRLEDTGHSRPQPWALGALHPVTAGLEAGSRHVRPELGLSHGHQRRGRHGEVVVVLLRREAEAGAGGRLQRGLQRGLERGLLCCCGCGWCGGGSGDAAPLPGQKRDRRHLLRVN